MFRHMYVCICLCLYPYMCVCVYVCVCVCVCVCMSQLQSYHMIIAAQQSKRASEEVPVNSAGLNYSIQTFNGLNEAYSHCGGQSAFLSLLIHMLTHIETPSQTHTECLTKYLGIFG